MCINIRMNIYVDEFEYDLMNVYKQETLDVGHLTTCSSMERLVNLWWVLVRDAHLWHCLMKTRHDGMLVW